MLEGPYISFILAALVGLFLAAGTFWFARKTGLQPAQTALIQTLQDNAAALSDQIKIVRQQLDSEIEKRASLERRVTILQQAVVDLAEENAELRRKLGLKPRGGSAP
jgi:hypothetical protein